MFAHFTGDKSSMVPCRRAVVFSSAAQSYSCFHQ